VQYYVLKSIFPPMGVYKKHYAVCIYSASHVTRLQPMRFQHSDDEIYLLKYVEEVIHNWY